MSNNNIENIFVKMQELKDDVQKINNILAKYRYKESNNYLKLENKLIDTSVINDIMNILIKPEHHPIVQISQDKKLTLNYLGFIVEDDDIDTDFFQLFLSTSKTIINLKTYIVKYQKYLRAIDKRLDDDLNFNSNIDKKTKDALYHMLLNQLELVQDLGTSNENNDINDKKYLVQISNIYTETEQKLHKLLFIKKVHYLISICNTTENDKKNHISKNTLPLFLGIAPNTFLGYLDISKNFMPDLKCLIKLGQVFQVPVNYFMLDMYEDDTDPYEVVSTETGINQEILYFLASINEQSQFTEILKVLNVLLFQLGTQSNPLINLINIILNNSLSDKNADDDFVEFIKSIKNIKSKLENKEDFVVDTGDYINNLSAESNYKTITIKSKNIN